MKKSALVLSFLLGAATLCQADSFSGTILSVTRKVNAPADHMCGGIGVTDLIWVKLLATNVQAPENPEKVFVVDGTNDRGKQILSILLTAWTTGQTVRLYHPGAHSTCTGGYSSVYYMDEVAAGSL